MHLSDIEVEEEVILSRSGSERLKQLLSVSK